MNKTELLRHVAVDEPSRLTLAQVLDKAELTRTRDVPANSRFLTDGEQILARRALEAAGCGRFDFWGGYPGAERKVCRFWPDWAEGGEEPLAAVEVTAPPGADLSHRDYLGSLTGLGITRDMVGDLLVGDGRCQAVCLRAALPILLSQWTQAGRWSVQVREIDLEELEPGDRGGKLRRETFRSLRFDAVAAAGFGLPRAKAAALIASGHIQLNHLPCLKPDKLLEEGDSLTARGYGKCVLARVTGESRKGRIMAELERYE